MTRLNASIGSKKKRPRGFQAAARATSSQLESFRLSVEEMLMPHIPDKAVRGALSVLAAAAAQRLLLLRKSTTGEACRVRSKDGLDGYKARQRAYRQLYIQHYGISPNTLGPDDYTPRDFLNEEFDDLIARKHLTASILIKEDYPLYRLMLDYVRGLRNGSYNRTPEPNASLKDFLQIPKSSVRLRFERSDLNPRRSPPRLPGKGASRRAGLT